VNDGIPPTDACCTNNDSGVLYVWQDMNPVCVTGTVLYILYGTCKTYSLSYVFYVILKINL